MDTLQEIEEQIREQQDPNSGIKKVLRDFAESVKIAKGDQGEPGEDGYTPIKGTDYFTEEEIANIITYIQSGVTDGVDGKDGTNGTNGRDGKTPVRGVDYFTKEDWSKMVQEVLSNVKAPLDGVSPKIEDIVAQVTEVMKKDGPQVNESGLINFLKRGGFRGGSSQVGAVVAINIIIKGGGSVIPTGKVGEVKIPYNMRVTSWEAYAEEASSSIVVDVLRTSFATFPTATSIAGTELPTIVSAQKANNTSIVSWAPNLLAGDVITFNVNSVTTAQTVSLSLVGVKT